MERFANWFLTQINAARRLNARGTRSGGLASQENVRPILEKLKQNVVSSKTLDDIFYQTNLPFLPMCEANVMLEAKRLKYIRKGLDILAQMPLGRRLLASVSQDVCFYATRQECRGIFRHSQWKIFLSSRDSELWGKSAEYLRTLAHELAHSRHAFALRNYPDSVQPSVRFFESVFDEVGARLTGERIYAQALKSKLIRTSMLYRPLGLAGVVRQLEAQNYFVYFGQNTRCEIGANKSLALKELSRPHLSSEMVSEYGRLLYYMDLYPEFRSQTFLNKVHISYNQYVIYPLVRHIGRGLRTMRTGVSLEK